MKSIGIIGSNLIGLLCADILSSSNQITIIDSELELGFPASFPGTSNNSNILENILQNQDQHNLFKLIRINEINFRTEWLCKLITHKMAKNGVIIYNRTRVIEFKEKENYIVIYTSGSDINPQQLRFDIVIDLSEYSLVSLGELKHENNYSSGKFINPKIPVKDFFVGICLIRDLTELKEYHLALERQDDLAEVWYIEGKEQFPNNGWIESKRVAAYYDKKLMVLDDYYDKAVELAELVMNL
ncbi:hypothetical protein OA314_00560 [bacterium]|nr:hypothetical protein [bacterium]